MAHRAVCGAPYRVVIGLFAWAAKNWAQIDGIAAWEGVDLLELPLPRLYHALVAKILDLNNRDEEVVKAEKKVMDALAELAVEPVPEDPDDPMTLLAPPIPGLREMPLGLEG